MSADCETFRRSFSVGRYRCTWSVQFVAGKAISSQCEWEPRMPRRLSPVLMREYRQKRNRVHAALAEKLGGPAVVIDEWGSVVIYPDGRKEAVTPKPAEKPAPTAPPKRYTLNTGARTVTATFTEYPDRVVHSLECSKYGDYSDMPQLIAWLKPLLERYEDDPRPTVMSNQHSGETAVITQGGMRILPPDSSEAGHG